MPIKYQHVDFVFKISMHKDKKMIEEKTGMQLRRVLNTEIGSDD